MKIFISWSLVDSASHKIAELIHELLPLLHDSWQPFLSSHNLKAGGLWLNDLFAELEQTNFGIVCMSEEQSDLSWVLFEAGSLAKAFSSARVVPLLLDIEPESLPKPLRIFQGVNFDLPGLQSLLETLSEACEFTNETKEIILSRLQVYWKDYKERANKIVRSAKSPKASRSASKSAAKPHTDEQLHEILNYCKTFERRLEALARQREAPTPTPAQPFTVTVTPSATPAVPVPGDPVAPPDPSVVPSNT